MQRRVLLAWSSGKDSAWSLHVLRQQAEVELVGLITTIDGARRRVPLHGTRLETVQAQARAVGLPLEVVPLPWPCSNEVYERAIRRAIENGLGRGATHLAFGDLFLEDVRDYRRQLLAGSGLEPLFPIWRHPTAALARKIMDAGLVAVITGVDKRKLSPAFLGRRFDRTLLEELPPDVDPCGENGEFHTCVLDGPMFGEPLRARLAGTEETEDFAIGDLRLERQSAAARLEELHSSG